MGQVHIYDPSSGSDTVFYTAFTGTGGILGVLLASAYPQQPYVFIYATSMVSNVLTNQIVRVRDSGGIGTSPKVIYHSTAGTDHFGGRMLWGSDGMLYVVVGEGGTSANAQDLTNTNGKVLRMTPAGKVPPDNPFTGSLIWAFGIRNSFGFDFDAASGFLWEEDNGPECNDELNLIRKGANYAWGPTETCSRPPQPPWNTNQDGPRPTLPAEFMATTVAPTGAGFCEGCGLPGAEGALFYGTFNTSQIRQVTLSADRRRIVSDVLAYSHSSFVLSIERGPDGALYFSDDTTIWKLVSA